MVVVVQWFSVSSFFSFLNGWGGGGGGGGGRGVLRTEVALGGMSVYECEQVRETLCVFFINTFSNADDDNEATSRSNDGGSGRSTRTSGGRLYSAL